MVINLLLLLSSATLVPLFFLKSGTLFLGFFGISKVYRGYQKQKLMCDYPAVEIANLHKVAYYS